MPSRVVCISSLDGAGGEEVGRLVAERLGLRLIDEEIIVRAAREAGVDSHVVADAEQRKSLAARVLKEILSGSVAVAPALGVSSPAGSRDAVDESDDFRGLIRTAIEEIAAESDCVIAAHAASVALSGRAGILRVLVTASPDTRSGRVARENRIGEREAAELGHGPDPGLAALIDAQRAHRRAQRRFARRAARVGRDRPFGP